MSWRRAGIWWPPEPIRRTSSPSSPLPQAPAVDVAITDPTGLCSRCVVSCLACQALAAGVRGFQLQRHGLRGLRNAVLAVVQGAVLQHEALSRVTVAVEADARLSKREREVLLSLERGMRIREVASELVLSENTVKTHLPRIYEKLGVDNRHDAVSRARLTGQHLAARCGGLRRPSG